MKLRFLRKWFKPEKTPRAKAAQPALTVTQVPSPTQLDRAYLHMYQEDAARELCTPAASCIDDEPVVKEVEREAQNARRLIRNALRSDRLNPHVIASIENVDAAEELVRLWPCSFSVLSDSMKNEPRVFQAFRETLKRPDAELFDMSLLKLFEGDSIAIRDAIAALLRGGALFRDDWTYLQGDPFVVSAGISGDPETAKHAERSLIRPSMWPHLCAAEGWLLSGVPESLRDKRISLTAVSNRGDALRYCTPQLKTDVDVILAAIRNDPRAIQYVPTDLPEYDFLKTYAHRLKLFRAAEIAEKKLPCLHRAQSPSAKAVWAADGAVRAAKEIELSEWADDIDFAAEVISKDARLWALLDPRRRANPRLVYAASRADNYYSVGVELADAVRQLPRLEASESNGTRSSSPVDPLKFKFANRFHDVTLVDELSRNRIERRGSDTRPVAVCIYPTSDYNNAFTINSIKELSRHYRVMYYEVSNIEEMIEAVFDATAESPATIVEIAGHGSRMSLAFSGGDPAKGAVDSRGINMLSGPLLACLRDRVAPGAHLVLSSCLNGQGRQLRNNVANMFASVFPQAWVHSAIESTNGAIRLYPDGSFRSAGFFDAEYQIAPRITV